ncbi:Hypothetical predicted protein [Paramuricea clavata]|uniref:Uncharacterized protein n=1 Tax=Paramuricea clavata TaxID=317549 RepID=A0A6S7FRB6_PARCT|nr:Hypothetical predicted protein [Paramuricea clavata]
MECYRKVANISKLEKAERNPKNEIQPASESNMENNTKKEHYCHCERPKQLLLGNREAALRRNDEHLLVHFRDLDGSVIEDLSSGDIAESHVQMKNDLDLGNSTEEFQDSCDNKFPDPQQDEQRIPFNFFYDTALELRHLVKDDPGFDSSGHHYQWR